MNVIKNVELKEDRFFIQKNDRKKILLNHSADKAYVHGNDLLSKFLYSELFTVEEKLEQIDNIYLQVFCVTTGLNKDIKCKALQL